MSFESRCNLTKTRLDSTRSPIQENLRQSARDIWDCCEGLADKLQEMKRDLPGKPSQFVYGLVNQQPFL
jgi:hypothetical protein